MKKTQLTLQAVTQMEEGATSQGVLAALRGWRGLGEGACTAVTEMDVVAAQSLAPGAHAGCLTPRIRGDYVRVV